MKSKLVQAVIGVGVAAAALAFGRGPRPEPPPLDGEYTLLDSEAEPLRSAFNADAGAVRVVMLVAPT